MRHRILLLVLVLACASLFACAAPPPPRIESTPVSADLYDPVKRMYSNPQIGFTLTFGEAWIMYESEAKMPPQAQGYARQVRESGGEMLFVAQNRAGTMYMRGIAEETALDPEAYFEIIQRVNAKELTESNHESAVLNGEKAVRWTYSADTGATRIQFLEYQIRRGRYNVRLSFWTLPSLFASYEPEFETIARSFAVEGRSPAGSFSETVYLRDGRVFRGVKTALTSDSLMVVTASGESYVFPKVQVQRVER